MDHHGDICSDAASGSSYDWNILFSEIYPLGQRIRSYLHFGEEWDTKEGFLREAFR